VSGPSSGHGIDVADRRRDAVAFQATALAACPGLRRQKSDDLRRIGVAERFGRHGSALPKRLRAQERQRAGAGGSARAQKVPPTRSRRSAAISAVASTSRGAAADCPARVALTCATCGSDAGEGRCAQEGGGNRHERLVVSRSE
jgi:hypothetical protein